MDVLIVTKTGCSFCVDAQKWFDERSIEYTVSVMDDDLERKTFYAVHGVNSVPQIFIGGFRIGGYDALDATVEKRLTSATQSQSRAQSDFVGGLFDFSVVYKPFRYPQFQDIWARHENCHWVPGEIDLSADVSQWKSGAITPSEKEYIVHILRLFTQSDIAVGQNYADKFIPVFKNNEVRNMLVSFCCREAIHQAAYASLNDTLGLPDSEYHAFLKYKEMNDKFDFMMESDVTTVRGLALALAKSVFNEGVSLFASFVMLLNFQRFGKLKGMGKVVEWSIRDETLHVEGVCAVFNALLRERPEIVDDDLAESIEFMARRVYELEEAFIDMAYDVVSPVDASFNSTGFGVEGLTRAHVKEYIKYITDRRLGQIGQKPIFGATNPIEWLEWILNGADHTNFFENRVTEYQVTGSSGAWDANVFDDLAYDSTDDN